MSLSVKSKNRIVAELIEPDLPDPEHFVINTTSYGIWNDLISDKNCWKIVEIYEEGDISRWEPRSFCFNFDLAMAAYYQLFGAYIDLKRRKGELDYPVWYAMDEKICAVSTVVEEAIVDLIIEKSFPEKKRESPWSI